MMGLSSGQLPSLRDSHIAPVLFFLISSIYFATITGVTSSNDGSHYALVRALVDRGCFEISPSLAFTEHQDYALNGDRRFSDRPPGTALMAAPFYALGAISPAPLVAPPSKHDAENPRWIYAVAFSALAGAATVTLFFLALRIIWEVPLPASFLAALMLAFATTMWKYGSVLFSHAGAALVVWLTLYLLLRREDTARSPGSYFVLGILLGFAPLVEYTHALFSIIVVLYVLWRWWSARADQGGWRSPALLALGALIPVAFLLFYNTVNFGGPFEISTFNVDIERWPQNEGFAADFATPLLEGLVGLLVYGRQPDQGFYNQGLFLLMPVTLLVLPGLWLFWRKAPRRHFVLIVGLFVVYLLLFAKSTTYNPATNDGRYMTPFLGLLFVPVTFAFDWVLNADRSNLVDVLLLMAVFGLAFISIHNQLLHIAYSWNYDFRPARLLPFAARPGNIRLLLTTVFRNAPNLPILWAGEGLTLLFWILLRRWRQATDAGAAQLIS